MSLYGRLSENQVENLLQIAKHRSSLEIRISVINTLSDQIEVPDFVIEELASLMQYDPKYQVREEALLALRRIWTEKTLSQIHAYGHKFLNGEAKPDEANIHPFLRWALSQKNNYENQDQRIKDD